MNYAGNPIGCADCDAIAFAKRIEAHGQAPAAKAISNIRPFTATPDGVFELSISGPMFRSMGFFGFGVDFYEKILSLAYASNEIKGILIQLNSGGGELSAGHYLADVISSRNKPVVVHTDYAASAAYLAISNADAIVATAYGQVGALGVVYIIDQEEAGGPKIIRSAISPQKLADEESAMNGDYSGIQKRANNHGIALANAIAMNRFGETDYKSVIGWDQIMSGQIFDTATAKKLNLIDYRGNYNFAKKVIEKMIRK